MGESLEAVRRLFDLRVRREVDYALSRRETAEGVIRLIEAERGTLIHSDLGSLEGDDAALDEVIQREIGYFSSLGLASEFEWKVYDYDPPARLKERLIAAGFVPEEPPDAVLVLDLAELPAELGTTGSHDIRRLDDPAQLAPVIAIMNRVWPEADYSWLAKSIEATWRARPDELSVYLAFVDGIPVAEGRIDFVGREFAGLWGGATLPEYRERGIYCALVAARAREAIDRGCRYLTIDARPMSRAVLEKRGFRLLCRAWACSYDPARAPNPFLTKN